MTQQLALVTGTSSGIGFNLAKQLVDHDFDVVIAAEDDELLPAKRALQRPDQQIFDVQGDLSRPEGVERLDQRLQALGRPLDAVAFNVGIGAGGGPFVTATDLQKELRIIDLNVRSTVHLAKLVLPAM